MRENRTRTIKCRITEKEYQKVLTQVKESGCRSVSDYLRRLAVNRLILYVNEDIMKDMQRKLSSLSNNMNQIAVQVNSNQRIYAEDINELKRKVDEVWQQQVSMRSILQKLRQ